MLRCTAIDQHQFFSHSAPFNSVTAASLNRYNNINATQGNSHNSCIKKLEHTHVLIHPCLIFLQAQTAFAWSSPNQLEFGCKFFLQLGALVSVFAIAP